MLSVPSWDTERLSRAWNGATPFPHLIVDRFLAPAPFEQLRTATTEERLYPQYDELYQLKGSLEPPMNSTVRAFAEQLSGEPMRAALRAITGLATSRVSLRAYQYDRGDYLLPHTDWREAETRLIAFAYYLDTTDVGGASLRGGALELYECERDKGQLSRTQLARSIAARRNRIALFAVTPLALHRVTEVTRGSRLSLAGWFIK